MGLPCHLSDVCNQLSCQLQICREGSHTSSVKRFSENFDQEAVTYLIFFVGTHWFQKCNFWKNSLSPFWGRHFGNFSFLAIFLFCQNGTFEPMHEIQKFFWSKAFFWSIMKMAIRNLFRNMSQGLPNPGFMQEKVQKGDFLWSPMMKKFFNPFFRFYTSRMHDFW